MLTIKLNKQISDEQVNEMVGKKLTDNWHTRLVNSDCDCIDEDSGKVLFKFRKKVIPSNYAKDAYESLRKAASSTLNRGMATYSGNQKFKRKDGTISNTAESAEAVNSGIIGYYDRYPRTPYCRTTNFTMNHFDKFAKAYPIIKTVDSFYRGLMPDEYAKQRAMADLTSPEFVIKDTAFTTVTVNKNWQTAIHTDRGDYKEGFGNLVVLRAGRFTGGYFSLPQYKVAIDLNNCDLLLVDVHQPHGNTPLKLIDKNAERISLVMYYRENMKLCGTMQDEMRFAKTRPRGDALQQNLNPKYHG